MSLPTDQTHVPPAPFDRRAHRAHRARAAKMGGDDEFLFDELAGRLIDRLDDIRRDFATAAVLGARGGGLAAALKARGTFAVACDLAPEMAANAGAAHGVPALAADEEWLPFADASLDLIVANTALHWINDLPGALAQIRRALKPDGLFIGAMFGAGTLQDLRDALAAAEIEIEGGISPRVSPFADVRDAGDLLARAGFALPVADVETVRVNFPDALALMRAIRAMGESGSAHERRKGFSRRQTLAAAAARYPQTADGRVEATFEVIFLAAWAPGPGQQKPLKPGSASARLADHLGAEEKPAGDKVPGGRKQ